MKGKDTKNSILFTIKVVFVIAAIVFYIFFLRNISTNITPSDNSVTYYSTLYGHTTDEFYGFELNYPETWKLASHMDKQTIPSQREYAICKEKHCLYIAAYASPLSMNPHDTVSQNPTSIDGYAATETVETDPANGDIVIDQIKVNAPVQYSKHGYPDGKYRVFNFEGNNIHDKVSYKGIMIGIFTHFIFINI